MSQAKEPFSPGPTGPEQDTSAKESLLISLPLEKCEKNNMDVENTNESRYFKNKGVQTDLEDCSMLVNKSDSIIKTQPQSLPLPNISALEQSEEETSKIQNGHVGLSNINGIHNGVKHIAADHRKLSAPVSQKMHRKIQSSLSVSSDGSKKSKMSSTYSQKPGASPEDCCASLILACLFCQCTEFILGPHQVCSCLHEACNSCCGYCSNVCVGLEEIPAEDLNFHFDCDFALFDSCCETAECLEICFECSELCEYS
ncbi:myoD family inhibitor domain-containing protein isoform X1 [Bufo gargarizans]|uniref:myoD family inhibitor domain-containing protein isoform X1 n=1 Tax=Bufo gargarizans TaxID=30331 RepID=UPI001CF37B91|nr:myoD family inhibitor domain-containing protein isoform X1 [Bufo gargarizans]XP_044136236.1 myoD family inhibitor domain-containing protein isoform X1 [Bufo gargarizans]XP_044136237.1 myoD family inhibitor domain-containing protein isoform X1 [Bufo gargarizans]